MALRKHLIVRTVWHEVGVGAVQVEATVLDEDWDQLASVTHRLGPFDDVDAELLDVELRVIAMPNVQAYLAG